jgi:hypothetical protein
MTGIEDGWGIVGGWGRIVGGAGGTSDDGIDAAGRLSGAACEVRTAGGVNRARALGWTAAGVLGGGTGVGGIFGIGGAPEVPAPVALAIAGGAASVQRSLEIDVS